MKTFLKLTTVFLCALFVMACSKNSHADASLEEMSQNSERTVYEYNYDDSQTISEQEYPEESVDDSEAMQNEEVLMEDGSESQSEEMSEQDKADISE